MLKVHISQEQVTLFLGIYGKEMITHALKNVLSEFSKQFYLLQLKNRNDPNIFWKRIDKQILAYL